MAKSARGLASLAFAKGSCRGGKTAARTGSSQGEIDGGSEGVIKGQAITNAFHDRPAGAVQGATFGMVVFDGDGLSK